jgi:hypothetical protein
MRNVISETDDGTEDRTTLYFAVYGFMQQDSADSAALPTAGCLLLLWLNIR